MSDTHAAASRVAVTAACFVSAVSGGMVFNVFPIYLGAAAEAFSLTETEIGLFAAAYIAGFALSSFVAALIVRKVSWAVHGRFVFGIAAVAFVLMALAPNFVLAAVAQFVVGICFGQAFAMVLCFLGDLPDVDRLFAFKIFSENLIAVVLTFLAPILILPVAGLDALLVVYAGFAVLAAVAVGWLPSRALDRHEHHAASTGIVPIWAWLAVLVLMVMFGSYTGVWAFAERIGGDAGFSLQEIGTALTISLVIGTAANLLAAVSAGRVARGPVLVFACLAVYLAFALLLGDQLLWRYAVGLGVFSLAWNVALPFQLGLVDELDSSGRLTAGLGVALASGAVFGPPIVGALRDSGAAETVFYIMGVAITLATVGFLLLGRIAARTK